MSKALSRVAESYVCLIDAIDAHPHVALWAGAALILLALLV